MDPYCNPSELGLEMLAFEEPDLCYEFNILGFWIDGKGHLYSASCSGCSCPSPFEDYTGETCADVLSKLQRIDSVDEAISVLEAWNRKASYDYDPTQKSSIVSTRKMLVDAEQELRKWLEAHGARISPPSDAYVPRRFRVAPAPVEEVVPEGEEV